MKRSNAKKTPKSIEPDFPESIQAAWFDEVRAVLSPYWSARATSDTRRTAPVEESHKHADAA